MCNCGSNEKVAIRFRDEEGREYIAWYCPECGRQLFDVQAGEDTAPQQEQ